MPAHDGSHADTRELQTAESVTQPEAPHAKTSRSAQRDDRYALGEPLGRGGMGEVLAARDMVLDREIAIKRLLHPSPAPGMVDRFLREARIQGTLDHPAIPPVHELSVDEQGRPYFVMKRLRGITLAEVLAGIARGDLAVSRRYPRERLLRAFAEVCLAVEFAHVRGVIHRDLKPSNVMLGEFGEVFVLDWGVAKVVNGSDSELAAIRDSTPDFGSTQAGSVIGTPRYMAPEQRASAERVDARADVYALGGVLYEILSGRRFDREQQDLDALSLPPELVELHVAAVAHDPSRRLPTARELGERVLSYLDGDRDLALRRRLASDHLERARSAMPANDEARRVAIREAGRALALDPRLPGAAELVGRLMLEPPRATPPDVAAAIEEDERRTARQNARFGVVGYCVYLAFVPYLLGLGGVHRAHLAMFAALGVVLLAMSWHAMRRPTTGLSARVVAFIVLNSLLVALCARMFSPFLVAPTVATLTVVIMVGSPAYRGTRTVGVLLGGMCLAIIVPWAAELAGGSDRTLAFLPLAPLPGTPPVHPLAIALGLVIFATGLIVLSGLLAIRRARLEDTARREVHLHAWRLRQLVPDGV